MSRKNILYIVLAFVLCLSFSVSPFGTSRAEAKKTVLKAISAWPRNENSVANDYLPFIDALNKKAAEKYPGQLEVKYIGGPEVIPTMDQPEALRMGTVDMYFGTAAYYVGIAPAANSGKLTELTSWDERKIGADALFDEIHRKKMNSAYLGRLGSEIKFQLYLNKKISSPDEIKGLKIRTSAMYIDFLKALGATPINTKPGDVYQALERGVVDGFMWPLFSIRPWGWQEVAKYVVGPPFYKVCHPILINLKKYDKMPKHIRKLIVEVIMDEARKDAVRDALDSKKEYDMLKKAGMKVIKFSPADTQRYLRIAYDEGWKGQLRMEKEYTSKLKKLLTK